VLDVDMLYIYFVSLRNSLAKKMTVFLNLAPYSLPTLQGAITMMADAV
jgi:hypothetical protein